MQKENIIVMSIIALALLSIGTNISSFMIGQNSSNPGSQAYLTASYFLSILTTIAVMIMFWLITFIRS